MLEGLDVSSHNAAGTVPWGGVSFGWIRVSHGMGLDVAALEHVSRATAADVTCLGAYHYLRGDSTGYGQAEVFWARVAQLEAGGALLALAVDLENMPSPSVAWDRKVYAQRAGDFIRRVGELSGRPCAVYGSGGYLASLLTHGPLDGPLWLAQWSAHPTVPPPWKEWTIHQYGLVEGVDRDRFAGSVEDWGRVWGLDRGSYDTLGGVSLAIERAAGGTPGRYYTTDEGPVIPSGGGGGNDG